MRSLSLLAAMATVAMSSTAALSQSDETAGRFSGYGSLWAAAAFVENWAGGEYLCVDAACSNAFNGDRPFLYGGDLQLNLNWSPRFSTQLDLIGIGGEGWSLDPIQEPEKEDGFLAGTLGLHLSIRDGETFIAGPFAAVIKNTTVGQPDEPVSGMVGFEAARFFGNSTLYVQGGYLDGLDYEEQNSIIFGDMWFVRGVGRYFPTPDTRIQVELGYGQGNDQLDLNEGLEGDAVTHANWGVELAHRFAGTQLSAFAAYDGFYLHDAYRFLDAMTPTDSDSMIQHSVKLGVRLHFGTNTLIAEDRAGATLDLPEFSTPLALYSMFDEFTEDF